MQTFVKKEHYLHFKEMHGNLKAAFKGFIAILKLTDYSYAYFEDADYIWSKSEYAYRAVHKINCYVKGEKSDANRFIADYRYVKIDNQFLQQIIDEISESGKRVVVFEEMTNNELFERSKDDNS